MAKRSGISQIVVGVDGSDHSAAALEWAARMAKGMGSEVMAVPAFLISTAAQPESIRAGDQPHHSVRRLDDRSAR